MIDVAFAKMIGLGVVTVVFIVTVLLMPWILGVNEALTAIEKTDDAPAEALRAAVPVAQTVVK